MKRLGIIYSTVVLIALLEPDYCCYVYWSSKQNWKHAAVQKDCGRASNSYQDEVTVNAAWSAKTDST